MTVLLIIIYITFISLGLPDSLFGVSWPLMHLELGLSESLGSIFTIIVGAGAGVSGLLSGALVRRFKTGKVTAFSVLLTAAGILGYSFSSHIIPLVIFSLILGLGAGAVDSVLNNFVSLHYKAIHMNFLHCFWGVGVTVSPLIMSHYLSDGSWRGGYRTIGIIQVIITLALFLTLPMWKKASENTDDTQAEVQTDTAEKITPLTVLKTKGVIWAILSIGLYCSMEFIIGTWGASYLVNSKGFAADSASRLISTFYLGMMAGRFVSGLLSVRLNDKKIIRLGIAASMLGIIVLALPLDAASKFGFVLVGFGFGPFFPCTLHATAERFGKKLSQDITGFQMGGGYAIAWLVQIAFGYIASNTTFSFMPYLFIIINLMLLSVTELINKITTKR